LAEKPDVAIIAVGASSIIPKIPGVEKWLENFYQWLKGLDLGEKNSDLQGHECGARTNRRAQPGKAEKPRLLP